jgi:hypothetical protein
MTGFDIALGIVVVLIVIAAAYLFWKRGPRPASPGGLTYRQMKEESRARAERHGGPGVGGPGVGGHGLGGF